MALRGALCGSSVGGEWCRPKTPGGSDVWDGTNVRFEVSQQAAKATNARNRNEPIRTHTQGHGSEGQIHDTYRFSARCG